jgi:hypothetical protein
MASWSTMTVNESIVSENGQTRIMRATLASPPGASQYFLRLLINLATP